MDVERKDEKIVPSKTFVWEETWNLEAYVYKISETGQSKSISGWKAFAISNGLQIGDKCFEEIRLCYLLKIDIILLKLY